MICDPMCPFLACARCRFQGQTETTEEGRKQGLTCENRAITEAAPAGNRGLTTTTIKESSDGCF